MREIIKRVREELLGNKNITDKLSPIIVENFPSSIFQNSSNLSDSLNFSDSSYFKILSKIETPKEKKIQKKKNANVKDEEEDWIEGENSTIK